MAFGSSVEFPDEFMGDKFHFLVFLRTPLQLLFNVIFRLWVGLYLSEVQLVVKIETLVSG